MNIWLETAAGGLIRRSKIAICRRTRTLGKRRYGNRSMDCPVSTYSFIERLTECGLYGFSLTQVLLLVALVIVGAAYAIWEHRTQLREERDEKTDQM